VGAKMIGRMQSVKPKFLLCISSCVFIGILASVQLAAALDKDKPLPGGRPEDVALAANSPDEYAWQLFLGINRQAGVGTPGQTDPSLPITKYSDDQPVVWETWALASGGRLGGKLVNPDVNYSEVYLNQGAKPLDWGTWKRDASFPSKAFEALPVQILDALRRGAILNIESAAKKMSDEGLNGASVKPELAIQPHFLPNQDQTQLNEVRMNRATYDFIRDQDLYSVEGLESEFRRETDPVHPSSPLSFPLAAQEIKAQWRPIRSDEKDRYHWRTIRRTDGTVQTYGLVALHIMTKDLPNWFWCTFVQEDYDKYPEMQSFDSTTTQSKGVRAETKGSKWAHYRLRGSQIVSVDSRGRYTVLANPIIENGFQQTASCITCHSRATVGLRTPQTTDTLNRLDPLQIDKNVSRGIIMVGPIGPTSPQWFLNSNGDVQYIQTDFVWSAPIRALSKQVGGQKTDQH
jgi:hypothetical protein